MLTYDIIIKELMPKKNKFSLYSNMIMNKNEFIYFKNIFDDSFYRIGIEEPSLKSSINYCVEGNIEIDNIDIIINTIDINIILFDFKDNKIYAKYKGDYLNPWKPTIFIANYEEWYEPIITKELKIFSFSSNKSNILKNNIYTNIIYIYKTNIEITLNDNFNEIINLEGFEINNSNILPINNSDVLNETFTLHEIPSINLLEKMKKDELIELCNKLNKKIKSKMTKKDLINIILN